MGGLTPLILFRTRDPGTVNDLLLQQPAGFTFDQSRLREADAVVFHIPEWTYWRPTFQDTPKFPGQLWIAYSMESKVNYKELADQEFMRHFDLRIRTSRMPTYGLLTCRAIRPGCQLNAHRSPRRLRVIPQHFSDQTRSTEAGEMLSLLR